MKKAQDLSFLEKVGGLTIVGPFILALLLMLSLPLALYNAYFLMQIWNILVPKVSTLPQINFQTALVTNLIVNYLTYRTADDGKSKSWIVAALLRGPSALLFAWLVASLFL